MAIKLVLNLGFDEFFILLSQKYLDLVLFIAKCKYGICNIKEF